MSLNFIDISSNQAGLPLPVLFEKNHDLHGVIVKAGSGTKYINPYFKGWVEWLRANGKPMGAYHYCRELTAKPSTPEAEAAHFFSIVKPYIGSMVFAADYELNNSDALAMGTGWLKAFLDAFYQMSGVRPLVYCSQSITQEHDFSAIAAAGYPLWLAQYADMNPVSGFLDEPWQRGSVAPFPRFIMQQYTSRGHLSGWSGNLDFDKFFGSYAEWLELARGESQPVGPVKPVDPVVVAEVLAGRYGIGDERVRKLAEDGYDPAAVQAKINELYGVAGKIKPLVSGNLDYLNSIIKIVRSV